jgi:hypothetical protein
MIFSESNSELFRVSTEPISGYHVGTQKPGEGYIDCIIYNLPFTSGIYYVGAGLVRVKQEFIHTVERAARIEVLGKDVYLSGFYVTNKTGFVICKHQWKLHNKTN